MCYLKTSHYIIPTFTYLIIAIFYLEIPSQGMYILTQTNKGHSLLLLPVI